MSIHVTLSAEPTNGVPAPLVFVLLTTWMRAGATTTASRSTPMRPGAGVARFFRLGGAGKRTVMQPMDNNELSMTLDLCRA